MKKIKRDITHEELLAKMDEVIAIAKKINQESAFFHKDHNHKKQNATYEQKVY